MNASTVESVVGATVKVVLQNLFSLCADEISLFRDFKKDLENLEHSFSMIQAFLKDAEEQQVSTNEAFKLWLKRLDAVAFDADDVLDELSYHVLYKKVENQNKMKKKVKDFFSRSNPVLLRREMAHKIRDINENLKWINEEATGFGLQRHVGAHVPTVGSDALSDRESDSFSNDSNVIGREDDLSKIVDLVTNNPSHEQVVSVIPIVGMGGLGKTTLARKVYNDERIKNHFEKRIWVYVSENFDDKAIFKKILESVIEQKVDLETKDVILRKLQQNMEAKRYLLVLDDVWIAETKKLDDFMDTLSGMSQAKGNSIIVTTRSEKVASIMRNDIGILLSKLSDENCWSIIKEKAFGKGNISPKFEIIGKSIAKGCQGLPLVAKVLGGMLRGKSIDEWSLIAETRLSDLGEDGHSVMKLLRLSFDYLPSPSLKKCFAYCSIFPKGDDINKELLIKLWMAEGFLQSDGRNDMEIVGNKYFELLIQSSLLQVVERGGDGIATCNMHDLVHDLAGSILDDTGSVRYIMSKSITSVSKKEAENLRSLIFEGKVHKEMFSNFKSLRVLILIGDDIEELPKIKNLIHLRFLDISCTRIEHLSVWIGYLYHLQTLIANSYLKELPNTIKNLVNLKHLDIKRSPYNLEGDEMRGIRNEKLPMLGHLPHLKYLCLSDLPNVKSICSLLDEIHDIGVGDNMGVLFPALKSLVLYRMSNLTELLTASQTQLCEVVAFPHLEYLDIAGCEKLTSASSRFRGLKTLTINGLGSSLILKNLLVNLTSLTELHILRVEGLVCLPDCLFHNNPNLSYLKIDDCPNLTHLVGCLRGCRAALRKLEIWNCPNLNQLPDDLHNLNSLEELYIHSCENLKSIMYDSVQGFASLRTLKIRYCDALTELPREMLESSAPSLEYFSLEKVSSLTNLATVISCLQKMTRLTKLRLGSIPELTNNSFPIEIGSFRGLRDLYIGDMENCESLPDQLQHLTALRNLALCSLAIETLPEWLGSLSSLQKLVLVFCRKLRRMPSKEAMQRLTNLTTLLIIHCPLLKLRRCDTEGESDDDSEWAKISHVPQVHVK